MANAKQSKLYLSEEQYQTALKQADNRPENLRLGQWLVNLYGKQGKTYSHIFYLDEPTEVWSNVEITTDTKKGP
jgi:hypothetical protein